jgi:hypothetical protein
VLERLQSLQWSDAELDGVDVPPPGRALAPQRSESSQGGDKTWGGRPRSANGTASVQSSVTVDAGATTSNRRDPHTNRVVTYARGVDGAGSRGGGSNGASASGSVSGRPAWGNGGTGGGRGLDGGFPPPPPPPQARAIPTTSRGAFLSLPKREAAGAARDKSAHRIGVSAGVGVASGNGNNVERGSPTGSTSTTGSGRYTRLLGESRRPARVNSGSGDATAAAAAGAGTGAAAARSHAGFSPPPPPQAQHCPTPHPRGSAAAEEGGGGYWANTEPEDDGEGDDGGEADGDGDGRSLHSSTFRLNLSAFCGIGVHLGIV